MINFLQEKTRIKRQGNDEIYTEWFSCNECGDDMITNSSNYCPNCGRKIIRDEKKN